MGGRRRQGGRQLSGADYRHVFGIAAAIAFGTVAIAGMFQGMTTTISPTIGTDTILLFAFASVVIGGLGSLWGTLLGGVILGVSQAVGAQINPSMRFSPDTRSSCSCSWSARRA